MGKCKHVLMDGEPCNIESTDVLCGVHRHDPLCYGHSGEIQHYAIHNKRSTLDLSGIHFENIKFDSDNLTFDKPVYFDKSKFKNCVFSELYFEYSLSFFECTFDGCHFERVNCKGDQVDFQLATFGGVDIIFRRCTFDVSKHILFDGALFESKSIPFLFTSLKAPQIGFNDCSIVADRFYLLVANCDIPFSDNRYLIINANRIFFKGMKVTGNFEYTNYVQCRDFAPIVLFSQINFSQMKTATFIEANLERARFTYSKLDNVHFITPRWPEQNGRCIVYDELEPVNNTTDEHIKDTYIQLKRNYEDGRKYSEAGEWFYREMECRRRMVESSTDSNWFVRWMTKNLFKSYRVVSDYGENLVKPFLWLLGLCVLWGHLYFYSGFGTETTINYDFAWPPTVESAWGLLDAMLYSLGVMSFQVTKTGFQHGSSTTAVTLAVVLSTLILVPLFLLALRRKFRR